MCLSTNKSKHRPSDQKFSKQRTESDRISHCFEAVRHVLKTFHEAYTIFLSGQRIEAVLEVSRKIFSTFGGLFLLLNNAMYRRDFGRFSSYVNKYLLFFRFTDFLRSSRHFSSIVTSISFYHVECGDGRQPRLLVNNF